MPSQTRAARTSRTRTGSRSARPITTSAARPIRKPSAPELPSRRPAPLTTSLTTRQAATAPAAASSAPSGPSSRNPAMSPITADSSVIRPRAEPCTPVVPASIPIAMPIPSSVSTSTLENLTAPERPRRSGTLPCMAELPPPPPQRRRAHTLTRDLERYAGLFAQRTGMMRSSAMRDLMAVTARPEVISLAGGLPDTSTFPAKSFAAQMTRIAQESAAEALQYGPTEGFDETVDCILQVMGAEGMLPDPQDVIVTTGGQQAIDLVCKTLVDPGDVVVCEAPTYPGAVPVFCSYQADVVQIDCDEDGMLIEDLESVLAQLDADGRRPKFVYSVPSFQNPAGVTMSLARRHRLVELARSREMLVVEDNPYGLLRFGGEPPAPLYQLDGGDFVIYIGTLSKILSPGIRLGWAVAPPPVMEKIVLGKQAADLCTSTLTQYFVREYFAEGKWREYVEDLTEIYRRRRDAMVAALTEFFPPGATWTEPDGGLFIWATLPEFIDTGDLQARALRDDVAFVPGQAAYVDERGRNSMRLNFSGVDEDEIREGVRRIGKVIAEQMELYGTLTGHPVQSSPGMPGREAEDMPVDSRPNPAASISDSPRADSGDPEEGDVLPFRRARP